MRCVNCGQDLADDMKFCTNCGSPVENQQLASQSESIDGVFISTTPFISGYRIVEHGGIIVASSASILARRSGFMEVIDTFKGNFGEDSYLSDNTDNNYEIATSRLIASAIESDCNAVVNIRYNEAFTDGALCVTAYGTGCVVEEEI